MTSGSFLCWRRSAALAALLLPLAVQSQGHGGHGGHAAHATQAAAPLPGFAQSQSASPAEAGVTGCWIRSLPARLPSAAYFVLENRGSAPLVLKGVAARDYGEAVLHMTRDNAQGLAEMVHLERLEVPAGGSAVFEPGGRHVMLMAPRQELVRGERSPLVLWTDDGRVVRADCELRSAAGR